MRDFGEASRNDLSGLPREGFGWVSGCDGDVSPERDVDDSVTEREGGSEGKISEDAEYGACEDSVESETEGRFFAAEVN